MHATQTPTDQKLLLSRLCHLVALSEAKKIEGVVDSLVANVVEIDAKHPAQDKAEVAALKVYFGVDLDARDLDASLSRLLGAGKLLRRSEKGQFALSPEARASHLQCVADADALETEVRQEWVGSIRKAFEPWTDQIESELWGTLRSYLARLFRRHGAQTALVVSGQPSNDVDLDKSSRDLLTEALQQECKSLDQGLARGAVQQFLREQTPKRARYVAQLLDGTFSFYTLFTDERTQEYLKAAIPRIVLFLDTNFLFGVLNLHDNPQNQVSSELVSLVREQKLPFELYYHEESLLEMQATITATQKRLSKHNWSSALSRAILHTRPARNVSTGVRHRGWEFRERFEGSGPGIAH